MNSLRIYGRPPFRTVVVHGGPGAPGGMAPVAQELAKNHSVLEPLQRAASIDGQVQELRETIDECGEIPAVLVGWSWGAWLSFIFASG